MLLWTPILNNYDKVRFMRDERFLQSKGIGADHYWVGPAAQMPPRATPECPIVIGYDPGGYADGTIGATTLILMHGHSVMLHSPLSEATALLTHVFDEPAFLQQALATNPAQPAADALAHFGLDPASVLKPDVGQYRPETYLAPTKDGWQLYLVEPHGEIVSLAGCAQPAPLAYLLATQIERQQTRLAERVAAFIPPDAAAIIKG